MLGCCLMLVLPTFNIIRLIYITTGLFASFIATTLLIYGLADAKACPADWKRDTYGNCSIRVGLKTPAVPAVHLLKATDIEDLGFDREAKNTHPGSDTSGVQVTLVAGGRI